MKKTKQFQAIGVCSVNNGGLVVIIGAYHRWLSSRASAVTAPTTRWATMLLQPSPTAVAGACTARSTGSSRWFTMIHASESLIFSYVRAGRPQAMLMLLHDACSSANKSANSADACLPSVAASSTSLCCGGRCKASEAKKGTGARRGLLVTRRHARPPRLRTWMALVS